MRALKKPGRDGEIKRLREANAGKKAWRRWGTYVSERQWGTVREDYSANKHALAAEGFRNYSLEWWHYDFTSATAPLRSYDFPVR